MKTRVSTIELEPIERNLISITIESKETKVTHYLSIDVAKKLSNNLLMVIN